MLLGSLAEKLDAIGVRSLGVIATDPTRARLYFRFRPPRMPMGADPGLSTHRAYGLPNAPLTPEMVDVANAAATRELRRLNQPVPADPIGTFARLDGFEPQESDEAEMQRHQAQLAGQFLVDRDGVVRWANVECAREGAAGFGDLPADDEILAAARAL